MAHVQKYTKIDSPISKFHWKPNSQLGPPGLIRLDSHPTTHHGFYAKIYLVLHNNPTVFFGVRRLRPARLIVCHIQCQRNCVEFRYHAIGLDIGTEPNCTGEFRD